MYVYTDFVVPCRKLKVMSCVLFDLFVVQKNGGWVAKQYVLC